MRTQMTLDMPTVETKYFGSMSYEESVVVEFPQGLPGFETEHRFLILTQAASKPLVFIQSIATPGLCFVAAPVLAVRPDYVLSVAAEDLALVELPTDTQPKIGCEVLVLAILSLAEDATPTLNLLGPIVVNLRNRRAVQAVQTEGRYSHREPVDAAQESVCS
jgi:flagellar assembly factor FliW